jgi:hypothetical protein
MEIVCHRAKKINKPQLHATTWVILKEVEQRKFRHKRINII